MWKCIKLEESLLACIGLGSWMLQKCKAKHQSCNFVKVDGKGLANITAITINNSKLQLHIGYSISQYWYKIKISTLALYVTEVYDWTLVRECSSWQ